MDIRVSGNNNLKVNILRKAAVIVLLSVFVFEARAISSYAYRKSLSDAYGKSYSDAYGKSYSDAYGKSYSDAYGKSYSDIARDVPTALIGTDDTMRVLDAVDVVARQPASGLRRRGNVVSLSSSALLRGMRVLGSSDAISALRLTPGISGGSDYASGLSVNGAPLSQSAYLIDGMPIFFPFHFGGIFSTFNTPHFRNFALDMTGNRPDAPMRAGAVFEATSADTTTDSVCGVADLGLISSSLTIKAPLGRKTTVAASARTSYINLIAPALIDNDDTKVRYSFTDANLTVTHRPDSINLLKISGFYNPDKVNYTDRSYNMDTRMRWCNAVAGASWLHTSALAATIARVSVSHSASRFGAALPQLDIAMQSGITQLSGSGGWSRHDRSLNFGAGTDVTFFTPQHPIIESGISPGRLSSGVAYAFAAARRQISDSRFAEAYMRVSMASSGGHTYVCADPRLTIERITGTYTAGIDVSVKTQYMQQVGFSDIGMSANFWLPTSKVLKPMRTAGFDLRYRRPELIRSLGLNVSVFARYVWHESQYQGMLTDILAPGYDALTHVRQVDGFNVGGNVMLDINIGSFSGWAGYSLAVCRREYPEYEGRWLPSASEPLHSLKILGENSFGRRWKVSAFFTLATGRRYTPVDAIYAIGGNILIEYGAPYSASLPLYHRLDLSATYNLNPLRISRRALTNFLTLSIINAYGHRNAELTTISYDTAAATISRDFISSLYRFLPSISYTLQF